MDLTSRGDGTELVLAGRLDVTTVAAVRDVLHAAIDAGRGSLVVDLSAVDITDATGLGVLVGAHRRAGRAGRTLLLRGAGPQLVRLFDATRLSRILRLEVAAQPHDQLLETHVEARGPVRA